MINIRLAIVCYRILPMMMIQSDGDDIIYCKHGAPQCIFKIFEFFLTLF